MLADIVRYGRALVPTSYLNPVLAGNNLRTRVDVASRCRPVQLEEDTGIGSRVCAGEGDKGAVCVDGSAATCDIDLRAGDVDLGTSGARGRVESDVFDSEEVFAVRDAPGDGGGDLCLACWGECEVRLFVCLAEG